MFDISKEVPSLDTCMKLKEIGFPQGKSGWFYAYWDDEIDYRLVFSADITRGCYKLDGWSSNKPDEYIKAPTINEILKYLPTSINDYTLHIQKMGDGQFVVHYPRDSVSTEVHQYHFVLVEALAQFLIQMIEKDYINFEGVIPLNKREIINQITKLLDDKKFELIEKEYSYENFKVMDADSYSKGILMTRSVIDEVIESLKEQTPDLKVNDDLRDVIDSCYLEEIDKVDHEISDAFGVPLADCCCRRFGVYINNALDRLVSYNKANIDKLATKLIQEGREPTEEDITIDLLDFSDLNRCLRYIRYHIDNLVSQVSACVFYNI